MTYLIAELAEVVRELTRAFPDENEESNGSDQLWAATRASNFLRTHHAEIEAMARDARDEREQSWEVWQDDMPMAVSDELPDALHYLAMYQQDGPVMLKRAVVYRETITPEQLAAMHDSARESGE